MHAIARIFPTSPNFFWIGVSGASSSIIIPAILPTLVFIPVSVTTASPWPFTAIVVAKAILTWSARGVFCINLLLACFKTGTVSPVKLASSIFKSFASINLQSAGT